MKTSDFRELKVWQKSMDVAVEVYEVIKGLPKEERFCLCDQMRRCSVSIPSNIAEGHNRNSTKEYIRFVSISRGSVAELQTQLLLCQRLRYISEDTLSSYYSRLVEIDKMLGSLMNSLERNLNSNSERGEG